MTLNLWIMKHQSMIHKLDCCSCVIHTFGTDVNYGPFWHMINVLGHTSASSASLALVMRFAP